MLVLAFINTLFLFHLSPDSVGDITGKSIHGFSLINQTGKRISTTDLPKTLLIIDFWYTGCSGCAWFYNEKLSKIAERFADEKDITFISISADKDFDRWLSSVASGVYTNPKGVINLQVGDLAFRHPLLKHFGIDRYPCLMVVDDRGNVFSLLRNPNQFTKDELLKLIEAVKN